MSKQTNVKPEEFYKEFCIEIPMKYGIEFEKCNDLFEHAKKFDLELENLIKSDDYNPKNTRIERDAYYFKWIVNTNTLRFNRWGLDMVAQFFSLEDYKIYFSEQRNHFLLDCKELRNLFIDQIKCLYRIINQGFLISRQLWNLLEHTDDIIDWYFGEYKGLDVDWRKYRNVGLWDNEYDNTEEHKEPYYEINNVIEAIKIIPEMEPQKIELLKIETSKLEYYDKNYFIEDFKFVENDKILHDLMREQNEKIYKKADIEQLISIYQLKQANLSIEEILSKIESLNSIQGAYSALRRYYGFKARVKGDYFEKQYEIYLKNKLEPKDWYVKRISGSGNPDIIAQKDDKMLVFSLKNEKKLTYYKNDLQGEIRYINDNLASYPNMYFYLVVFNEKANQIKIEKIDYLSFDRITINF